MKYYPQLNETVVKRFYGIGVEKTKRLNWSEGTIRLKQNVKNVKSRIIMFYPPKSDTNLFSSHPLISNLRRIPKRIWN